MLTKISLQKILADHFQTLRKFGAEDHFSWSDIFGFFALPLLASAIVTFLGLDLSSVDTVLITSFSIFAALLFNLLMLTHGMIIDNKATPRNTNERDAQIKVFDVMHELFANISYSILISIAVILLVLLSYIKGNGVYQIIIKFLAYFLVGNFIFTLMMVLRRTHSILSFQFKNKKEEFRNQYKDMI